MFASHLSTQAHSASSGNANTWYHRDAEQHVSIDAALDRQSPRAGGLQISVVSLAKHDALTSGF